jgi:hypothetical protein
MLAAAAVSCPVREGGRVESRYLARALAVVELREDLDAGRERRVASSSLDRFTFRLLDVSSVGSETSMWWRRIATVNAIDSTI